MLTAPLHLQGSADIQVKEAAQICHGINISHATIAVTDGLPNPAIADDAMFPVADVCKAHTSKKLPSQVASYGGDVHRAGSGVRFQKTSPRILSCCRPTFNISKCWVDAFSCPRLPMGAKCGKATCCGLWVQRSNLGCYSLFEQSSGIGSREARLPPINGWQVRDKHLTAYTLLYFFTFAFSCMASFLATHQDSLHWSHPISAILPSDFAKLKRHPQA